MSSENKALPVRFKLIQEMIRLSWNVKQMHLVFWMSLETNTVP